MNTQKNTSNHDRHGGRVDEAARLFPDAPLPWIDLSTGINPHAWIGARADFAALRRLPDPAETAALEKAASTAFNLPDPSMLAAVPGAEAGLRLLPRLTRAASVGILFPTYGGHAEAWQAAGRDICALASLDTLPDTEALVIVNPNNPDGRTIPPNDLLRLAKTRLVIVDESFGDVAPHLSVAPHVHDRLIVLRSFGKFYGLAGVRLGFIVAGPLVIAKVRAAFGDWPVSAEALAAGTEAYADRDWAQTTRALLQHESQRLDLLLTRAGLKLLGGTVLFRLCATPQARLWFTHLARHGILVRPFAQQPDWLRFGLPGAEADWARLEEALQRGIA
jgi:cobalamin biosynthesis protein CobC